MYHYWLWREKLSKELCEFLLDKVDWEKEEVAKIGVNDGNTNGKIKKSLRDTKIVWEEPLGIFQCIIDAHIRSANIQANWNLDLSFLEQVQLGKYQKGGKYNWHTDIDATDFVSSQNPRKLSCSILLNDPKEFEGGELEFKGLEKAQPNLKQGDIIVFPSIIEHRVAPIKSGVRYSAVSWMRGNKIK